ncbi:MAG: peptidase, partial [Roseomonas sp.]|nr:peptidase [Roseomonas sp.]
MTYCVGLLLDAGMVLLSDTRTNAGVDNISVFGKTFVEQVPGERVMALLTAGNLAVTQAVWNRLQEGVTLGGQTQTLQSVPTMFRAAQLVGEAVRQVFDADGPALRAQGIGFDVSIMLGGQIAGSVPRL